MEFSKRRRRHKISVTTKTMKQQMKFLFMWTSLLTFLGCGQANKKDNNAQTNNTEQYVSMDCQTGDITLTLNSDKTFDLTILFWDDRTHQHAGQENVKGNWSKADKILTLTTDDNNKIVYELTTTNMKIGDLEINSTTYGFKSNDKDFFATSFDLLEKKQTDEFLINATKQQK
jgi:hypothetical protein